MIAALKFRIYFFKIFLCLNYPYTMGFRYCKFSIFWARKKFLQQTSFRINNG
ncbi:hypothetical protein D1BOALGB6SA_7695 [Olavius sp. associated proteobacterium Delta 1]|nr:hypothetical protein D1BOALGB6SA_7695 [Olavius sp. associated proteobacterium Delta 1]